MAMASRLQEIKSRWGESCLKPNDSIIGKLPDDLAWLVAKVEELDTKLAVRGEEWSIACTTVDNRQEQIEQLQRSRTEHGEIARRLGMEHSAEIVRDLASSLRRETTQHKGVAPLIEVQAQTLDNAAELIEFKIRSLK